MEPESIARIPEPVTDADDPRLADYAGLKDAALRADEFAGRRGTFIGEGEFVVRVMARTRFPVRSVLGTPARLAAMADVLHTLPPTTRLFEAPEPVIRALVGFEFHRGVLACGVRTPPLAWADVARDARALVVAEGLTSAENLGSIFRITAALGGSGVGVLLDPRTCDPLYRRCVRVSMGHALRVPYARAEPWPGALASLREFGFRVVALTPDPAARDIRELPTGERYALLLGSEGFGLTPEAFAMADVRARIAQAPGVDSLNVGVACALALHRLVEPG